MTCRRIKVTCKVAKVTCKVGKRVCRAAQELHRGVNHFDDLANYLVADVKASNEAIKYFFDPATPLEAFVNYFTWLARFLAKLANQLASLAVELS